MPPLPAATGKTEELDGEKFNQILQSKGLTLPRQALVGTAAEAVQKAKEIGFPVAMKLIAPEVVHKTESGAVVLGLNSAEEVEAQGKRLLSLAKGSAKLLCAGNGTGNGNHIGRPHRSAIRTLFDRGTRRYFRRGFEEAAIRLLPV